MTSFSDEDYEVGKPLGKKTSSLFNEDDDFYKSFESFKFKPTSVESKPKPKIKPRSQRGKQIQKETFTYGASPPNNASSFTSFSEQLNQSRRRRRQEPNIQTPPVVDLAEQFDKMIEQYNDVIIENNLTETIIEERRNIRSTDDIENWDKRLNAYRNPNARNTSPIPIPGSFPTSRPNPSTPVIWAGQTPPDSRGTRGTRGTRGNRGARRGRGGRGKNRNQNQNYHHHHNEFLEQKEGTSGGEESESSAEEVQESHELTDLQILYPEQIEQLNSMGFKEEEYVELLINHKGDVVQIVNALFGNE